MCSKVERVGEYVGNQIYRKEVLLSIFSGLKLRKR